MTALLARQAEECGTFDLGCQAGAAFAGIVADVARGAADLVVTTAAWWAETDSVDPRDSAVIAAQGATRELVLVILVGSVLVQAIRLILSRKGEPLIMVATGLIRYAVVSALGLVVLQMALRAGDALATELLDGAAGNFALLMEDLLVNGEGDGVFLVLLFSLIAAVLSLVQWVLMAMRQAGLLVLAAMLPLAAAGSLTRSTRGWLDKLLVWLIAMVVYKPAAAFIYYIGFSYLSSPSSDGGGDVGTMITGIMVLLLAVIAMPVLLKFFAWSGTQVGGGGGSGSGFLGAVGAVAMSQGYGRGAVDRAAAMDASGPGAYATFGHYPPPAGAAPAAAGGISAGGAAAASGAAAAGVVAAGTAGAAAVRGLTQGRTGDSPPDGGSAGGDGQ
ncbi:conjugal transfer protein TrbL family protein [Pseudonocardia alni]|uniref:conjugal transfer protein TrbL family protein n=1 Tax=Pseudonocardia alni TaxID=33907 RepID=UPI00332A0BB6